MTFRCNRGQPAYNSQCWRTETTKMKQRETYINLFYIGHRERQFLSKFGACGSWEKGRGEKGRGVDKYIVV